MCNFNIVKKQREEYIVILRLLLLCNRAGRQAAAIRLGIVN
jgi:hypothetical protein